MLPWPCPNPRPTLLQKIQQEGRPRAQQLAEQYAKPMGDNASNADQAADQLVEEKLKPVAQDLSNQMQPAADQFSEEQLKPMAAKVRGRGRATCCLFVAHRGVKATGAKPTAHDPANLWCPLEPGAAHLGIHVLRGTTRCQV